ncbi:MAG: hypothetical protein JWP87_2472 [Labilithrix sp.]|nr:hypothetical protein [Labilithrix sp.]
MTTSSRSRTLARRAGRTLAATLFLAVTAVPVTSFAQPEPTAPPSAADLESARELFKEGRELRQKGELRPALDRFKAAHAYGQTPVTALELGRTHVQLGELVEGREVLLSVARMKVQPDETDKSAQARAEAADLAEETKKRIPTLAVKVTGVSADSSAQLTVDGFAVPIVGLTGIRKANPGKHVVVARAGAHEETRSVDLEEGKTQELAIDLSGAGGAGATAPAVVVAPDTSGKNISPVTWIGLGVGVVGIGVGTAFGVIALGKASKVNDACTGTHCPPTTKSDVDSGRSAATISTIGFAVGGAGLVAAAVGYFVLSKPSASAFGVVPFVTANGAGLDGHF